MTAGNQPMGRWCRRPDVHKDDDVTHIGQDTEDQTPPDPTQIIPQYIRMAVVGAGVIVGMLNRQQGFQTFWIDQCQCNHVKEYYHHGPTVQELIQSTALQGRPRVGMKEQGHHEQHQTYDRHDCHVLDSIDP